MTYNELLLNASKLVIEPFSGRRFLTHGNVKSLRNASKNEDMYQKIDFFAIIHNITEDIDKEWEIQVKTLTAKYNNFSIAEKDIIAGKDNKRLLCFVDMPFDEDTCKYYINLANLPGEDIVIGEKFPKNNKGIDDLINRQPNVYCIEQQYLAEEINKAKDNKESNAIKKYKIDKETGQPQYYYLFSKEYIMKKGTKI